MKQKYLSTSKRVPYEPVNPDMLPQLGPGPPRVFYSEGVEPELQHRYHGDVVKIYDFTESGVVCYAPKWEVAFCQAPSYGCNEILDKSRGRGNRGHVYLGSYYLKNGEEEQLDVEDSDDDSDNDSE